MPAPVRSASVRGSSLTARASTRWTPCGRSGNEAVIVNNNPETVSTDAQRADRLYSEPLDSESVLAVPEQRGAARVLPAVRRTDGAEPRLQAAPGGSAILGTALSDIERAEDRFLFEALLEELGVPRPPGVAVSTREAEGLQAAQRLGFPLLCALLMCWAAAPCASYMKRKSCGPALAAPCAPAPVSRCPRPLLHGHRVEVDALCDGSAVPSRYHRTHRAPASTRGPIGGVSAAVAEPCTGVGDRRAYDAPWPRAGGS